LTENFHQEGNLSVNYVIMEPQITKSEFFSRIREKTLNFSPKNMALANFVVQNYQRIAFLTARQLAQECGVSESTVMRFVTALDYTGYPDFLRTRIDSRREA
jgi:DNA-binding MurR/RpiR family transcriptional regulator